MVLGILEPEAMEVAITRQVAATLVSGAAILEIVVAVDSQGMEAASPEAGVASLGAEEASQEAQGSGPACSRRMGSSTSGTSRGSSVIKPPWPPTTATTATMAARSGESKSRATRSPNYLPSSTF